MEKRAAPASMSERKITRETQDEKKEEEEEEGLWCGRERDGVGWGGGGAHCLVTLELLWRGY